MICKSTNGPRKGGWRHCGGERRVELGDHTLCRLGFLWLERRVEFAAGDLGVEQGVELGRT